MSNLYNLFLNRLSDSDRQAVFIQTVSNSYSFTDTFQLAGCYAHALLNLGVQAGDRVVVQVNKSSYAIFLYLACLQISAIYVPLNMAYRKHELEHFLLDADPVLLVCDCSSEVEMQSLVSELNCSASVVSLGVDGSGSFGSAIDVNNVVETVCPSSHDDIAAILYTSGTTGRSKGAMLSHGNLIANVMALSEEWQWQQTDVLLHALPLFHIHGLFVALHCALWGGSKLILLPEFEVDAVVKALPEATVFMGVPTYYTRLLTAEHFTRESCTNIRLLISGSAPLLERTFRTFQQRTGLSIIERYGMTELGIITSNPLEGRRKPGTVGLPLMHTIVRVVDDIGKILPCDEIGMLEVSSPSVFKGYWRLPDKTRLEFKDDGFFVTGDLGFIDADGYVSIVGRSKDLIITGGYNVYPKEVEVCIDALPAVIESAVFGVAHPDYGEAVVAVVNINKENESTSAEVILKELKTKLAGYKVPKQILLVSRIPRNTMGKVEKNSLRIQYANIFLEKE